MEFLSVEGIGITVIGIIAAYVLVLRGIFMIGDDQVGILTKKFGGKSMPPGQIIARRGEVGVQAKTLMPGLYYRFPIFWTITKVDVIDIQPGNIGIVESIDGVPLLKGRLLGDEVDCNHFQDAEAFLDNKGQKGLQVPILGPGTYRINTMIFKVTKQSATKIEPEQTGIVSAQDGIALPKEYIIAPKPETETSSKYPNAKPHRYFQDGQAFINSGGYRGTQLDTLQPGQYYINPHLFKVDPINITEIPPGFVAVLRSNVGPQAAEEPRVDPEHKDTKEQVITTDDISEGETVEGRKIGKSDKVSQSTKDESTPAAILISDRNTRGIWKEPVNPGKYNLNEIAFTIYLVPTSAVTIDWAASTDIRTKPTMPDNSPDTVSRRPTTRRKDRPDSPLVSSTTEEKALAFFRFEQLTVTSQDGFQLDVDVRMVIRILPQDAAWIIARFGTVENLIEQIIHPLIDSSFRNKAGEKKAIDFIKGRSALQAEALEKAKKEFEHYHVQAQNLLISYIAVDQSLLDTQTAKEIALQQQEQFKEMAKAEEQRIAVQEKTARANMQPEVVKAALQIDINKNNAQAAVEEAKGQRDAIQTKAEGEAKAIATVGEAQAKAYEAQANVIGRENLTFVNVMKEVRDGKIKIVPDVMVSGEGNGGIFGAWFADQFTKPRPRNDPPSPETRTEEKRVSGETQTQETTKEIPKTKRPM